jgi:hypothetical protein
MTVCSPACLNDLSLIAATIALVLRGSTEVCRKKESENMGKEDLKLPNSRCPKVKK